MPGTRLVVTGLDSRGRSCVVTDGPLTDFLSLDYPGLEFARVWSTENSAAPFGPGAAVAAAATGDIYPPAGGSRFHLITYPSGFGAHDLDGGSHPLGRVVMHRTDSIDYGIVLSGVITLVLEDASETELRPNDLLVQNASMHGWRNVGTEPAVLLFVMVGTEPA